MFFMFLTFLGFFIISLLVNSAPVFYLLSNIGIMGMIGSVFGVAGSITYLVLLVTAIILFKSRRIIKAIFKTIFVTPFELLYGISLLICVGIKKIFASLCDPLSKNPDRKVKVDTDGTYFAMAIVAWLILGAFIGLKLSFWILATPLITFLLVGEIKYYGGKLMDVIDDKWEKHEIKKAKDSKNR